MYKRKGVNRHTLFIFHKVKKQTTDFSVVCIVMFYYFLLLSNSLKQFNKRCDNCIGIALNYCKYLTYCT